jgi:hypothetical protein
VKKSGEPFDAVRAWLDKRERESATAKR